MRVLGAGQAFVAGGIAVEVVLARPGVAIDPLVPQKRTLMSPRLRCVRHRSLIAAGEDGPRVRDNENSRLLPFVL